jgi:quinol-cytochrome oxidoreductase complex cytochrome b subunit
LVSAAVGVLVRNRRSVAVVVLGLALPLQLLDATPALRSSPLSWLGWLQLVVGVILVAIFLADLDRRPLSSNSVSSVVTASMRVFAATLIVILFAVLVFLSILVAAIPLLLAAGPALRSQHLALGAPVSGLIVGLVLLPVLIFLAYVRLGRTGLGLPERFGRSNGS